jgi:hypothetical protein
MFAVYASHANIDDPLSALRLGEQPEPEVRAHPMMERRSSSIR